MRGPAGTSDAPFDQNGDWAAKGSVHTRLLARMLRRSVFFAATSQEHRDGVTSTKTGSDEQLRSIGEAVAPADVQRTLCELCAANRRAGRSKAYGRGAKEVYLCGGGVHKPAAVRTPLPPDSPPAGWPEPTRSVSPRITWRRTAFAWLAVRTSGRPDGQSPLGDRSERRGGAGRNLSGPTAARREAQIENDDPQPQVVLAFGFLTTNCDP